MEVPTQPSTQSHYNVQNADGRTALILTVLHNQYDLAMKLVPLTDLNIADEKFKRTALSYAVMSDELRRDWISVDPKKKHDINSSIQLVKKLIEAGADCDHLDDMDKYPFVIATVTGMDPLADILLEHIDLSRTYDYRRTLFLQAIVDGRYEIALKIIDRVDPNVQDCFNRTALMYLVASRGLVIFNAMLYKIIFPRPSEFDQDLIKQLVVRLLALSANCDIQDGEGMTALMFAVQNGNEELVRLIQPHSNPSLTSQGKKSVVHHAVYSYPDIVNQSIMELLVGAGTNCNLIDDNNYTPLMLAIRKGASEYYDTLIQHSDINLKNKIGNTALYEAVSKPKGDPELVRKLVRAGADLGIQYGDEKQTVLMIACLKENVDVANILLEPIHSIQEEIKEPEELKEESKEETKEETKEEIKVPPSVRALLEISKSTRACLMTITFDNLPNIVSQIKLHNQILSQLKYLLNALVIYENKPGKSLIHIGKCDAYDIENGKLSWVYCEEGVSRYYELPEIVVKFMKEYVRCCEKIESGDIYVPYSSPDFVDCLEIVLRDVLTG